MSIILSVCETRVWFIKKCLLRKILVTRHIHCFTDRCTILRACFLDNFSVHNFLTPDFVRYSNIRSISRNISTFVAVCSAILFPFCGWTFSHMEPYLPWRTERLAIFSLNFLANIIGHYVTDSNFMNMTTHLESRTLMTKQHKNIKKLFSKFSLPN